MAVEVGDKVPNYDFNAAHRDHFHIDDVAPGFRQNSKSATFFVQNALSFVLGQSIGRDGVFGPQTAAAVGRALNDMGVNGSITNLNVWRQFLTGVARGLRGRVDAARGGRPLVI